MDVRRPAPALVLGTAQLRGTYGAVGRPQARRSDHAAESFLRRAIDLGFSAIDTAPAYDDAEEVIGRAVRPGDAAVHTKLDPQLDPATSVARSLSRLRRDRIDVLYFHDPQISVHDPGQLVEAAGMLVGDAIDKLGTSVYESAELDAAVDDGRFRIAQVPMSVVDRRIDDIVLERAADADVQIVARSVFLQGLILATAAQIPARLGPLVPYVEAVHALARETETPPAALALGWVKQRPGIVGVVVGAHEEAELEELTTAWSSPPLDDAVVAACGSLPMPPDQWCDPRRWPS